MPTTLRSRPRVAGHAEARPRALGRSSTPGILPTRRAGRVRYHRIWLRYRRSRPRSSASAGGGLRRAPMPAAAPERRCYRARPSIAGRMSYEKLIRGWAFLIRRQGHAPHAARTALYRLDCSLSALATSIGERSELIIRRKVACSDVGQVDVDAARRRLGHEQD